MASDFGRLRLVLEQGPAASARWGRRGRQSGDCRPLFFCPIENRAGATIPGAPDGQQSRGRVPLSPRHPASLGGGRRTAASRLTPEAIYRRGSPGAGAAESGQGRRTRAKRRARPVAAGRRSPPTGRARRRRSFLRPRSGGTSAPRATLPGNLRTKSTTPGMAGRCAVQAPTTGKGRNRGDPDFPTGRRHGSRCQLVLRQKTTQPVNVALACGRDRLRRKHSFMVADRAIAEVRRPWHCLFLVPRTRGQPGRQGRAAAGHGPRGWPFDALGARRHGRGTLWHGGRALRAQAVRQLRAAVVAGHRRPRPAARGRMVVATARPAAMVVVARRTRHRADHVVGTVVVVGRVAIAVAATVAVIARGAAVVAAPVAVREV